MLRSEQDGRWLGPHLREEASRGEYENTLRGAQVEVGVRAGHSWEKKGLTIANHANAQERRAMARRGRMYNGCVARLCERASIKRRGREGSL